MKLFTLVCYISINVLTYSNLLPSQNNGYQLTAFAVPVSPSTAVVDQLTCSVKNDRVLLNWIIDNNQSADQIAIESGTDGKNFTMTALVFGTDKKDSDSYAYYEKVKKGKTYYRLKIINKDSSVQYSAIVTP